MLFHIRINALICILWLSDVIAYILILDNLISNGFSGTILFASEVSVLVVISVLLGYSRVDSTRSFLPHL